MLPSAATLQVCAHCSARLPMYSMGTAVRNIIIEHLFYVNSFFVIRSF